MDGSADCVVVGGGLVGTALAYELTRRGTTVVVVDRHDPGRASDAGAGVLSPETSQDPSSGAFAVGTAAVRHYERLVDLLGADGAVDTGYARTGSLLVALRPGDDATMDAALELVRGRGTGVRGGGSGSGPRHFPVLGDVRRALHNPDGRRIDGRVLRDALQTAAERRGATWRSGSVVGLVAGGGRVDAVRTDGRRHPGRGGGVLRWGMDRGAGRGAGRGRCRSGR